MGSGQSALGTNQDADEKTLKESQINEQIGFYRNWSMEEVKYIMSKFSSSSELKELARILSTTASKKESWEVNEVPKSVISTLFDLRVTWNEFYSLVYETEDFRIEQVGNKNRQIWHPSTGAYAMVKDEFAESALEEYLLGDDVRPNRADHDEDQYTSDEESDADDEESRSSGDGSGSESGSGSERDSEEGNNPQGGEQSEQGTPEKEVQSDEESAPETPRSETSDSMMNTIDTPTIGEPSTVDSPTVNDPENDNADQNSDGSNPDSEVDPDALPPPPTDSELLNSDDNESTHSNEIIPNLIPDSFNPELRSPIFFGYTTETLEDVSKFAKEKTQTKDSTEASTVERKIEQKKTDLQQYITDSSARKISRGKRIEHLKNVQQAAKVQREGEYIAMEKTMPPDQYKMLKRQFETDEEAAGRAAKAEMEELGKHNEDKDKEEDVKRRQMEQGLRESIENESNVLPAGAKLERTSRIDLKHCVTELDEASDFLDDKQQRLDGMQEELKDNEHDPTMRSMLIVIEGQVEEGERKVENALKRLEETELLLQRALRRKAKENLVLPLYSPLANSIIDGDFSVGLVHMIVALAIVCSDQATEKLHFLVDLFDINSDEFLASEEMSCMISSCVKVLEVVGFGDRKVDDDEVHSIVLRAFYSMGVDQHKGMTMYEAQTYAMNFVSTSAFLTTLFNAQWKYGEMSTYMRQVMTPARQYEVGLIAMPDLKYHVARDFLRYRPALDPIQKALVHERALAMGADDPMKPDYSKFLPKKKRNKASNVIPLEHGPTLTNLTDYRDATMMRAAKRLQNVYRGKLARQRAEDLAKKEAFYAARDIAIEGMKKKVGAEFEKRENEHGIAKMKWDASVRKKQIQLRAAGKNFDRDGVIGLLMDETIKSGQDEIEARFHELAVQRGFEEKKEIKPEEEKDLLSQITSLAVAKQKNVFAAMFKRDEMTIPKGDIVTPRAEDKEEQVKQTANTQIASLTAVRRAAMIRGVFPKDLYKMGEMFEETMLKFKLGNPDPNVEALLNRLRAFDKVMTFLKVEDMLQELPAKRLLLKYVTSPFWKDDNQIYKDFEKHFRIIRNSNIIVDTLRDVANTDLETGIVASSYQEIVDIPDYLLQIMVSSKVENGLREASDRLDKLSRSSEFKELGNDDKVALALERDDFDLKRRQTLVTQHSATMEKLIKRLTTAQIMLDEAARKRENMVRLGKKFKGVYIKQTIEPAHRLDWMERFLQARAAPEATPKQEESKYYELSALAHDFLATATKSAMIIIDEMAFPVHKKSIKPVDDRTVDGRAAQNGRGDVGLRYKYEANGIRFKIHVDDHGLFNGSDEAAAKAAGNDCLCALEYSKCHVEDVVVPFETTIDYSGFRVLAVAKLPVAKVEFNESGDVKRIRTELVLGSSDRGLTCISPTGTAKYLDLKMSQYAKELNLSRHFVKGENDMNAKEVYSSVDIRGFKGKEQNFYLLNFWRGMPSENPKFTPHLPSVPRGNSIFYRLLRPEFVKTHPTPLSPNANTRVTEDSKDWIKQLDDNETATQSLVLEVIPDFADELAIKHMNPDPNDGYGVDISADLHRNGINVRHMGAVRQRFWRKLRGTCSMIFHSRKVITNRDFSSQLERGDKVKVLGEIYHISKDFDDDFNATTIYLDRNYEDDSKNFVEFFAGEVDEEDNSEQIRELILAEMVARTIKNLLRLYLRHAAMTMKISVANIQVTLMTEFLNIITGANVHSDRFWSEQLYMGIVNRFGSCAIAETERKTYRVDLKHMIVYIIKRFTDMFGIQLTNDAISQLYATPALFRFVPQDINKPGPRVKHNIADVEFADAVLLSYRADRTRSFDYQNLIVHHKPFIYWKLGERKGSRVAHNYGKGSMPYSGYFSARCEFELEGPVKNDDLNRCVEFKAEQKCKIDTKYARELCPTDVFEHFSIEAWACCTGCKGTNRVVMMTGRASLLASREETWCFVIYEAGVEVVIEGPKVENDKFHHLVGTYDGTLASFYIDGTLVRQLELRPEVTMRTTAVQMERQEALKDLLEREKDVRDTCKAKSEEQAGKFLITKEGRNLIRQNAIKLVEHSEFRVKMDKKAAEKGMVRLSKKDAQAQAVKEYKEELYMKNVQSASEEYRKLKEELDDQNTKDDEYARELLSKAMCVGSSVSSRKSKDGRNFFEGFLCHIAAYTQCLSSDHVREHCHAATQSRQPQADRLYSLAAVKFQRALKLAPDDPVVLKKYAQNLCNYLSFDEADRSGDRKSKRKVKKAIKEFTKYHNCDGLAEILRRLPSDPEYADLACECYTNILQFSPNYFKFDSYFTLKELSVVPFKFSLTDVGSDRLKLSIAADMFRKVVGELSLATAYGEENLKWIQRLESDAAVVSVVIKAQSDADPRIVDLTLYHDCSDLTDGDLANIADAHRLALVVNIKGAKEITDKSLIASARCCSSLQALTIDGCEGVTGKALDGLKQFTPNLKLLSCQQCKFIDDSYLLPMLSFVPHLCVLNLNNCDLVTDNFLKVVGVQLRHLELLHLAFCTSLTDEGLYQFAVTVNTQTFTSLDLTCCRSITDDALVGIAEKCKALKYLNICGVNRCTEIGGKAITHNCWDLEYLNMEDLDLITDNVFHFDSANDGRRAVDQNMLSKIIDLNVSECARLTDKAVGGISQRCANIEILNFSGCALLTDECCQSLVREPRTGMPRGEKLRKLKLGYCMQLTDRALEILSKRCVKLNTLDLSGLVHLTDPGIRKLVMHCKSIQNMCLSRCKRLTDKALCNLADYLWIEELDISNSSKFTDEGLDVLSMEFTGLIKLNISSCEKITNRGIVSLGRHCLGLKQLQAVDLKNVSRESLEELDRERQHCRIVMDQNEVLPEGGNKLY